MTWHSMKTSNGKSLGELREEFLAKTGTKVWVSRYFASAVYDSELIKSLMEQLVQALSAPADAATNKPHFGYWDGRHDFRTGMDTLYGIELATRTPSGVMKLMLRHDAVTSCPSGLCGVREERILWLDASSHNIAG